MPLPLPMVLNEWSSYNVQCPSLVWSLILAIDWLTGCPAPLPGSLLGLNTQTVAKS